MFYLCWRSKHLFKVVSSLLFVTLKIHLRMTFIFVQNADLVCFSWKSELFEYLVWLRLFTFLLAEKSKFPNKYQIFFKKFDDNSWKLDLNIKRAYIKQQTFLRTRTPTESHSRQCEYNNNNKQQQILLKIGK